MSTRLTTTNSDITDPLAELKKNLENLDSLEKSMGVADEEHREDKAAPPPLPAMPPPMPTLQRTSMPPALPTSLPQPPALPGGLSPKPQAAMSQAPLAVSAVEGSSRTWRDSDFLCPEMPPPLPDPGDNPFNEAQEARMPRAASPEEKVEYFRGIVKAKSEALARARSLYLARVGETKRLREVIEALNGQLDRIASLQSLPDELEAMRDRLDAAEHRAERADELEDELEATAQRCVDLEHAVETFEMKLLKLQAQVKIEKQAAAAANETSETLKAEQEDQKAKIGELERELLANKDELLAYEQLKGDFATMEARAQAAEAQMELKDALRDKLEADIASLNQALADEKDGHAQALSRQQKSLEEELSQKEAEWEEMREKDLEEMRARYQSDCRDLEGQLEVSEGQLKISREECERLVVEKEDIRQKLERQIDAVKQEMADERDEALSEAEEKYRQKIADLQKSAEDARKSAAKMIADREAQLREEFEEDLALEKRQMEEKEQAAAEQYENEIQQLEEAEAKAHEELERLRGELTDAHDALSEAKEMAEREKAESEALLEQKLSDALDEQEVRHAKKLQELTDRHEAELRAARSSGSKIEDDLRRAMEEQDMLSRDLDESSARCDELQAALDGARAEQQTLSASLKAANSRAAKLEIKAQQDAQEKAELSRVADSLKAELAATREKLETSRQAGAALRQENRRLMQDAASQQLKARSQASEHEGALQEAQDKVRALEMRNSTLQRQVASLTAQQEESRVRGGAEAQAALERETVARMAAEGRAKELERALAMATQALRDAAKAGLTLGTRRR